MSNYHKFRYRPREDGLHPSDTGYAAIANVFIATMNAHYGTAVPLVNIGPIYASDPFRLAASSSQPARALAATLATLATLRR